MQESLRKGLEACASLSDIGPVLNAHDIVSEALIIGAACAIAPDLLKGWAVDKLLMFEQWHKYDNDDDVNISLAHHQRLFAEYATRCVYLDMSSWQASKVICDGEASFVLIADSSDYNRDLDLWLPKVKPGGLLGTRAHCQDHGGNEIDMFSDWLGVELVCVGPVADKEFDLEGHWRFLSPEPAKSVWQARQSWAKSVNNLEKR